MSKPLGLDARRRSGSPCWRRPSAGPCTRASARGSGRSSAALEVLVDHLLVAALVLQLDATRSWLALYWSVSVGEGVALGRLHRVPERDLHRLVDRVEGVDRARGEVGVAGQLHRDAERAARPVGRGRGRRRRAGSSSAAVVVGVAHGWTRQIVVGGPAGAGSRRGRRRLVVVVASLPAWRIDSPTRRRRAQRTRRRRASRDVLGRLLDGFIP